MAVETLDEFADAIVRRAQREGLYTTFPAIVRSVSDDGRYVSVELGVKLPFAPDLDDDDFDELPAEYMAAPLLSDVPVAWLGVGGYALTFPLSAGDTGMVRVCTTSIDEWYTTGQVGTEPADPRRFNLRDAVFEPALRPLTTIAADYDPEAMVLSGDEHKVGSSLAAYKLARADKTLDIMVDLYQRLAGAYVALRTDVAVLAGLLSVTPTSPPTFDLVVPAATSLTPSASDVESDQIKVNR